MRRQLAIRSLAVSSLLVLAFVVPLCVLVRSAAQDRADDQARADVASLIPVIAVTDDPTVIAAAAATTVTGQAQQLAVVTPDRVLLGSEPSPGIRQALDEARSLTLETNGDIQIIRIVQTDGATVTAIAATVTSDQRLRGVTSAWTILGGAGVAMIAIGVFATDRLGRSIVKDIEELAVAAEQLGEGDLSTRVEPSRSDELRKLGATFNLLGSQVEDMIDRERGTLAAMSHRLRTPLTRLRLRIDQVDNRALAEALHTDLADATDELTNLIQETRGAIDQRAAPEICDATAVTADRLQFWQLLADEQERTVSAILPAQALPVRLSEASLAEIIDILLDNIFTHTSEGTAFTLTLETSGSDRVRLSTSNTYEARTRTQGSGIGHQIITDRIKKVGGLLESVDNERTFTAIVTIERA